MHARVRSARGHSLAVEDSDATIADVLFLENPSERDAGGLQLTSTQISLILQRVTFRKNQAAEECGAIEITSGDSSFTNCTFDGNKSMQGGAILCEGGGTLTLTNCTLARNEAKQGSGIFEDVPGGGATAILVANSIFANTKASNYSGDSLTTLGHNIDTGTTCGFLGTGDLQSTNPKLAKKAKDNGGLTPTIALKVTSPAIDAADDVLAPVTDQRSNPRVDFPFFGGSSITDIGAFELSALRS